MQRITSTRQITQGRCLPRTPEKCMRWLGPLLKPLLPPVEKRCRLPLAKDTIGVSPNFWVWHAVHDFGARLEMQKVCLRACGCQDFVR